MKLLHKTGLYYLTATAIMYAIGSLAFYHFLRLQLRNDTIEKIYDDKNTILRNLQQIDSVNHVIVADDALAFSRIAPTETVIEQLKDTDMLDTSDNEMDSYVQYQFKAQTRNAAYKAVLTKSLAERENLIRAIAYSFLFLLTIFITGIFFINWWISKRIWSPFYFILSQLRQFNLDKGIFTFSHTNITEFKELNAALESVTRKMKNDYQNLKEFTENASHEMQTPLAGIRSKVELMFQHEALSAEQASQLAAINESVNRLSRLNQSLLLLSKIENEQFLQTGMVNIRSVLEKQLSNLGELIEAKGLKLNEELMANPEMRVHPYLIEILISNLLMNAIRHNVPHGFIRVKLDEHSLTIQNSGNELKTPPEHLFNRFKKDSTSVDSLGLGLSIARKICDTNNLRINYSSSAEIHHVILHF